MILYYIPLILLGLVAFFELQLPQVKVGIISVSVVAVFLILFAGFRTVGPDFAEYTNYFNMSYQPELLERLGVEPAYIYINSLVKTNNWPFQIVLFIIATIAIVPKLYFIKKYSPYVFPALVVYYSTVFLIKEMGQIRHGVAMGFVLMAFGLMSEKRNWAALFLVIVALQFHYSAVCVLPAFLMVNRQISSMKIWVIITLLFPLVLVDVKPFFNAIVNAIPVEGVRSKGEFYLNSPMFGFSVGLDSSVVLRIVVMAAMLYYRDAIIEKFPTFNTFLNLYFIGICYYLAFSSVSEFAQRTSVYFRSLEIIILPSFILLGKTLGEKLLIGLVIIVNGAFTVYKLLENPLGYEMFNGYSNQLMTWIADWVNVIN